MKGVVGSGVSRTCQENTRLLQWAHTLVWGLGSQSQSPLFSAQSWLLLTPVPSTAWTYPPAHTGLCSPVTNCPWQADTHTGHSLPRYRPSLASRALGICVTLSRATLLCPGQPHGWSDPSLFPQGPSAPYSGAHSDLASSVTKLPLFCVRQQERQPCLWLPNPSHIRRPCPGRPGGHCLWIAGPLSLCAGPGACGLAPAWGLAQEGARGVGGGRESLWLLGR